MWADRECENCISSLWMISQMKHRDPGFKLALWGYLLLFSCFTVFLIWCLRFLPHSCCWLLCPFPKANQWEVKGQCVLVPLLERGLPSTRGVPYLQGAFSLQNCIIFTVLLLMCFLTRLKVIQSQAVGALTRRGCAPGLLMWFSYCCWCDLMKKSPSWS